MDKQLKKIYLYIGIFVAIIFIGATYAFFTAGMSSETSTTVRADAGTMKITYDGGANITLSGIYPRDEVWATKNITVTGNNTTEAEMYYKLTLVVDSNTFKTSDPLQYELVSTNTSTNGEVIPAISKTDITSSSIELGSGHFVKANNARHTYQLKIYYPNKTSSQNDNQDASFSAHVEITSIKVPKTSGTLAELILYNNEVQTPLATPGKEVSAYTPDDITETSTASVPSTYQKYYFTYGTSWETNGDGFDLTGTAVTNYTYANSYSSLVGKFLVSYVPSYTGSKTAGTMMTTTNLDRVIYVVSATLDSFTYKVLHSPKNTTEALLASTEDDYGTSYYFRGKVKNNYVQFANKCWRIVRILGDGSVKLVLHNDNTSAVSAPCSSTNNSDTAAFAHYDGDKYTSVFNEEDNDNAYVGLMYGTTGSSDYASTHANINKSTILTNLETWYKNNLTSYGDKITDTIWCTDKNIVTDSYNPWNYRYAENIAYYNAAQRLLSSSGKAGGTGPSLKCNGELSKITTKIGLLSADELAFAGYASGLINTTTYLQENATGSYWWSLSPEDFDGYTACVWSINNGLGSLWSGDVIVDYAVRPSISLISSTTVSSGSGTSENPYVID